MYVYFTWYTEHPYAGSSYLLLGWIPTGSFHQFLIPAADPRHVIPQGPLFAQGWHFCRGTRKKNVPSCLGRGGFKTTAAGDNAEFYWTNMIVVPMRIIKGAWQELLRCTTWQSRKKAPVCFYYNTRRKKYTVHHVISTQICR